MEPVEPVILWGDGKTPVSDLKTVAEAMEFIKGADYSPELYIQDADGNDFELLSTGKWNPV
jgi:hypothetical protein